MRIRGGRLVGHGHGGGAVKAFAKILRAYLGCAGLGGASAAVTLAATNLRNWERLDAIHIVAASLVCCAVGAWSAISLIAWRKLHSGAPGARRWAIIACILQIPAIGVGTLAGIAGLIVFRDPERVKAAARTDSPAESRAEGDGTHGWTERAVGFLGLGILVASVWWWSKWASAHHVPSYGWLTKLPLFALSVLLSILIHEAGHVMAGWCVRMKLGRFEIGPLSWRLDGGRMRFRIDWNPAAGLSGGAAGMVPTDLRDVARREAVMIAGGPAVSTVFAAAFAAAALASPGTALEPAWLLLAMLATCGAMGGPLNLVPMKVGPLYSDGAQLWQLLQGGPWGSLHASQAMVASSLATPLRPRDWDARLLDDATRATASGMYGFQNRVFSCMHYLDAGRMAEAEETFRDVARLYHQAVETTDGDMLAELLFFSALIYRNPAAARIWWGRVEEKGDSSRECEYWRGLAALQWLENDAAGAAESLAKAEKFARELPTAGAYDFDRDSIERLRIAIEESVRNPSEAGSGTSAHR